MNGLLTVEDRLSCIVAARWVSDQLDVLEDIIPSMAHLLETVITTLRGRSEPLYFFSLWLEFHLEVLVIPPCASRHAVPASQSLFKEVAPDVVRMLGAAIQEGMSRTDTDLLVHEDDGGTEVLVYHHNAHFTVQKATGIVYPERSLC